MLLQFFIKIIVRAIYFHGISILFFTTDPFVYLEGPVVSIFFPFVSPFNLLFSAHLKILSHSRLTLALHLVSSRSPFGTHPSVSAHYIVSALAFKSNNLIFSVQNLVSQLALLS